MEDSAARIAALLHDQEREAAEHRCSRTSGTSAQCLADPVCELLVERHQAEMVTGSPSRPNSSGWRGKPVMPTIRSPSIAKTITP